MLLVTGLLLCAPAARGQAEASAPANPPSSVDALIDEGIRLRRAGDDQQALQRFEAAAAQDATSARVRAHLAATHQALGEWLEAEGYLRELLDEKDDAYVQRHRDALEQAWQFVERRIGSLSVRGGPEGAEVRLNGRPFGVLPMTGSVRVATGSYVLEVQKAGYYPARLSLNVSSGDVLREAVQLQPLRASSEPGLPPLLPPGAPASSRDDSFAGSPPWLSWTLTGLAGGAAVVTSLALVERYRRATEWNGDDCLRPGLTRGDVCAESLDAGRDAERLAYWGLGATLLFGTGAVLSWSLSGDSDPEKQKTAGHESCSVGLAFAACSGRF
jgi:tetratricopeptide (TPR) repeat protein